MPPLSIHLGIAGLLAGLLAGLPAPARAETYATCTGFVDSVPTTISTQGNWCLRKDLSTAITSGRAIHIDANNVTLDCNGFKVGGLAAGPGSEAKGIFAIDQYNVTIRNCTVRGFQTGIVLAGGGHLVEDNRIEANLYTGVQASGDGNIVQRNRILDTGGATGGTTSNGFYGQADLVDNTIAGIFTDAPDGNAIGMYVNGDNQEISGNRIRGLVGDPIGIIVAGAGVTIRGNNLSAVALVPLGNGITGSGAATACINNTVAGFSTAYSSCEASAGNLSP